MCLQDLLAEAGMLGRVLPFGQEETSFGIWPVSPSLDTGLFLSPD